MRKKVKEMIDIIEADGWFLSRQKGSHKIQTFNQNGYRNSPRPRQK